MHILVNKQRRQSPRATPESEADLSEKQKSVVVFQMIKVLMCASL